MNLKGRIKEIIVEPLAGDEIDEIKKDVKALSIFFRCKVLFNHNADKFICDAEGNIAKLN